MCGWEEEIAFTLLIYYIACQFFWESDKWANYYKAKVYFWSLVFELRKYKNNYTKIFKLKHFLF